MSMPVAILVGGLAMRLRPLTEDIPKALIPINGRPFLAHQLDLLKSRGITDVVICAFYRGEQIEEFAGDGNQFGLNIRYSYDGPKPLGTGGAVRKALPLLGDAFFVLYGDSYLPIDYLAVEEAFKASGKDALMTVYRNKDQGDRSNVQYENGRILAYNKVDRTKEMHYIDYGLGAFKSSAFATFPDNRGLDLAKVYQVLLIAELLAAYEVQQRFYEVGSFEGIRELETYLKEEGA
jgi:MurNAc alpha-1-phosphate uridylyltransferase